MDTLRTGGGTSGSYAQRLFQRVFCAAIAVFQGRVFLISVWQCDGEWHRPWLPPSSAAACFTMQLLAGCFPYFDAVCLWLRGRAGAAGLQGGRERGCFLCFARCLHIWAACLWLFEALSVSLGSLTGDAVMRYNASHIDEYDVALKCLRRPASDRNDGL